MAFFCATWNRKYPEKDFCLPSAENKKQLTLFPKFCFRGRKFISFESSIWSFNSSNFSSVQIESCKSTSTIYWLIYFIDYNRLWPQEFSNDMTIFSSLWHFKIPVMVDHDANFNFKYTFGQRWLTTCYYIAHIESGRASGFELQCQRCRAVF